MNKYWHTAKGKQILYKDLEDDHLKNIIDDGYRSEMIEEESKKRGFEIPERAVDQLSTEDLLVWVESFASTAISGNAVAETMIGYWATDRAKFMLYLNTFLERNDEPETMDKNEAIDQILPTTFHNE